MSIFSWGFARAGVVLYSYEDGSYKGMFVCKNPLIFTHYFNICALFMGCQGFPDSSAGKESACSGGDPSSIPGSEWSAEEGIGYPLQYSGLENSMDCIVHGVAKSRTRLSDFHL